MLRIFILISLISISYLSSAQMNPGEVGSNQSICYGSAPGKLAFTVQPSGGAQPVSYRWQRSNDGGVTWNDISGTSASFPGYSPPILGRTTLFRCKVTDSSSTPQIGFTNTLTIHVSSNFVAGSIGSPQTIFSGTTPATITESVAPSGGGGVYTFQWQSSQDGVYWSNISGATNSSFSPGAMIDDRWFRRVVSDLNCGSASSNSIRVTVNPITLYTSELPFFTNLTYGIPLEIGTEFTGLTDGFITSVRLYCTINDIGNHNVRIWRQNAQLTYDLISGPLNWDINVSGPGWQQLQLETAVAVQSGHNYVVSITTTLSPENNYFSRSPDFTPILTNGFLRYVKGGIISQLGFVPWQESEHGSFRDVVFVPFNSGSAGIAQSVCYNSVPSALLQTTPPTGGTGSYSYQWQISTDGLAWVNIVGASLPDYSPPAMTATSYFRRNVVSGTMTAVGNIVQISVITEFSPGTTGYSQSVCHSTLPSMLTEVAPPTGGNCSYSFQWQTSPDSLSWTDIPGATSQHYSPPSLVTTSYFRRAVTSGELTEFCQPVKISVISEFSPGSIGTSQTICYNSSPNSLIQITPPMGGTCLYNFQWQRSYDETNWVDIENAVSADFSPGTLTETTYFRRSVISGEESELTNPVQITVNTLTAQLNGNADIYENTASQISISISGGISPYSIEYMRNGIIQNTVNNYFSGSGVTLGLLPLGTHLYELVTVVDALGCESQTNGSSITINVTGPNPGSAGVSQTICYNSAPSALLEMIPPSGGNGIFSFQWQSSTNGLEWIDIDGATSSGFSPPALQISTRFRRAVTSGEMTTYTSPAHILVNAPIAQLMGGLTIYENTSTFFTIDISEGLGPYRVEYTRNGIPQTTLTSYTSGTEIFTGSLPAGTYIYELTSVSDASGCGAQSLGTTITIAVANDHNELPGNNALLIINSSSVHYEKFVTHIKPYIDWFGIPFELCDVYSSELPDLGDYALIIFGHRNVYSDASEYPISDLEAAVMAGTGLYSFDRLLFETNSGFSSLVTTIPAVTDSAIIINTNHYITEYHTNDSYHPTNSTITFKIFGGQQYITIGQSNYDLIGGIRLATLGHGTNTPPLLQVAAYGSGKIVKWNSYDWMDDEKLGPVWGMDDLIWRSIVWAARKPFVMQGLPAMITMRVDDVDGTRSSLMDLGWLKICNEFGLIPWCGTFIETTSPNFYRILRELIDSNLATASPHSFDYYEDFLFYNRHGLTGFDAAENVRRAWAIYEDSSLTASNYIVPHWYLLDSMALSALWDRGVEFIGTKLYCNPFPYPGPWLHIGPYRIGRDGWGGTGVPLAYASSIDWLSSIPGDDFFICMTEIGDDGGYEWYPNSNTSSTTARGVRHLRRALNSMVLPTLFTHEDQIMMEADEWRQIIAGITSAVSSYNPEYKSMDDAVKYVRAKENIEITSIAIDSINNQIIITCSGTNDMETKCYVFTETNGQISHRLVTLPMVNSLPVTTVTRLSLF
jgi:hypothetical protein